MDIFKRERKNLLDSLLQEIIENGDLYLKMPCTLGA